MQSSISLDLVIYILILPAKFILFFNCLRGYLNCSLNCEGCTYPGKDFPPPKSNPLTLPGSLFLVVTFNICFLLILLSWLLICVVKLTSLSFPSKTNTKPSGCQDRKRGKCGGSATTGVLMLSRKLSPSVGR